MTKDLEVMISAYVAKGGKIKRARPAVAYAGLSAAWERGLDRFHLRAIARNAAEC